MKKTLIPVALVAAAAAAITAQNTQQVLMTVDGNDIYLSEFEYLYNKNNTQQLVPLTFDQYVDMFVNYKLKVADAKHMGIDTTAAFKAEISKFRRDLAQPYLADSTVAKQLVDEAYAHMKEQVYVSHIMLPGKDPDAKEKLDSIRNLILSGTITFEDAARQNSIDRNSAERGGSMAWVTPGGFPWAFEKASYDTPVGQISPVVNSGIGYHLVRPDKRRVSPGEAKVEHILVFTRGLDEEGVAKAKAKIDSIYQVVTSDHVEFADVARAESQDRGSAQNGGLIDWFSSGQMVEEFDSVAFALPIGAISEPFSTRFGYHIVHKLDQRGVQPLEAVRPAIQRQIDSDARKYEPIKARLRATANKIGASIDNKYRQAVKDMLAANNNVTDSALISNLKSSNLVVFEVDGTPTTLGEAMMPAMLRPNEDPNETMYYADRAVQTAFDNAITDYIIADLTVNKPDYRNLLNEYSDGILLFDASQQNVWDKAAKDKKGLEKVFKKNKKRYTTWEAPKYKAYVIFTSNDSVLNEVQSYVNDRYGNTHITKIDHDAFVQDVKSKFGSKVKVERVIAAKGENKITDYLAFGCEKPENRSSNFKEYFAFAGAIIDQPEEYLDVKGQVLTDYQTLLEKDWLKKLHKKYKVVINRELLETMK